MASGGLHRGYAGGVSGRRPSLQPQAVLIGRSVQDLLPLGQRDDPYPGQPERAQLGQRRLELSLAAVDEDEVGEFAPFPELPA